MHIVPYVKAAKGEIGAQRSRALLISGCFKNWKGAYVSSDVRIEFIDNAGKWEILIETKLQLVSLHKDRIIAGLSRAGSAAGYRVVEAESGKVLDRWYPVAV